MNIKLNNIISQISDIKTKKLIKLTILGSTLGLTTAFTVDNTLFQISENPFISIYFGVIFIILGTIILYNSIKTTKPENIINSFSTNNSIFITNSKEKNYIRIVFSIIILLSGIFCFFLKKNWTKNYFLLSKIIIFEFLGISLCFLIIFGILDFVNFLLTFFQNENSLAFVETKDQSITLLVFSVIMGSFYGFIYSIVKIEKNGLDLKNQLFFNYYFNLPFGVFFGIFWILVNEVLAMNSGKYKLVGRAQEDPFDEEI